MTTSAMRRVSRVFGLFAVLVTLPATTDSRPLSAQAVNPLLLTGRWPASWIRHAGPQGIGVFLFRKTFDVTQVPEHFVVHASADQRYELFVNGTRVATGPARGDLEHWRFETVDLASKLHAGRNLVAAIVWNFGADAPMAQVSYATGFILQGDGTAESAVNTNRTWKTAVNAAVTTLPIDQRAIVGEYYVGGPGEVVDAAQYPWGWERPEFDDAAWTAAATVARGGPRGMQNSPSRWFLVPRAIPLMEDTPERLDRVVRSEGGEVPAGVLHGTDPWIVPAHATVTALFDRSYLTTAHPEVVASGGKESTISLTYAEALHAPGQPEEKGNRNDVTGKVITGLTDRFLPDGGRDRMFRPLWWRAFRYVQVTVQTADEPLVISDIRAAFDAYPLQLRATFESSDPVLGQIFDVGWRTARLCAHETYMDTPYWEQLQYIGDTRIQAMVSLYASGDDRLVKNAIELFDESRIPDGITQSRYPGALPQFIPPFSLFWIGMMHDLWWYGGDRQFLQPYLPGARDVLGWFEARLSPTGLLGKPEWWNFADWAATFNAGEPPMLPTGQSAILSLQLALALREAADLEEAFGSAERAAHDRALASRIAAAVAASCWDAGTRLMADTPAKNSWSQHSNLLAVLADALPAGTDQRALMARVLDDRSLTQTTYYFKFYLFRAMEKAGLADRYLDQLGPWRAMLDLGLTTWAEQPEPTRSDSHAWSAHPTVDLLRIVAGIEPAVPGFAEVRIRPHLGALSTLSASVPTPRGTVSVSYARGAGSVNANVVLPRGMTGTIAIGAGPVQLHEGRNVVTLPDIPR